jgi:hypothetical protein
MQEIREVSGTFFAGQNDVDHQKVLAYLERVAGICGGSAGIVHCPNRAGR